MNLFGKKKSPTPPPPPLTPKGPSISEADREWVDRAFKFIISIFGSPSKEITQIDFSGLHFPETFKGKNVEVSSLIADLCKYLELDINKIKVEYERDLRDTILTPYRIAGRPFQSELEIITGENNGKKYLLRVANFLIENPDILVIRLIVEMVKIKFAENEASFFIGNEANLLIYLLGIYFGMGGILASKLYDIRIERRAGWKRTSTFNSGVPLPIMAYALALFAKIQNEDSPYQLVLHSQEMEEEFNLSVEFLEDTDMNSFQSDGYCDDEFASGEITKQASKFFRDNMFDNAKN